MTRIDIVEISMTARDRMREIVRTELGYDADIFFNPDGVTVTIPARQAFKADTLDDAIKNAKSWIEMMTKVDE